jgi:hypothetical protein
VCYTADREEEYNEIIGAKWTHPLLDERARSHPHHAQRRGRGDVRSMIRRMSTSR